MSDKEKDGPLMVVEVYAGKGWWRVEFLYPGPAGEMRLDYGLGGFDNVKHAGPNLSASGIVYTIRAWIVKGLEMFDRTGLLPKGRGQWEQMDAGVEYSDEEE